MKERTTNNVICADNGALHVLTKKRIVRKVDEYDYIGLECDDAGEWKPIMTSMTAAEVDEWCAAENPKHDNVFRFPRGIELERLHSFAGSVMLFFKNPEGLTLEALRGDSETETGEMILLLTEIYEAAHKSMGIAIDRIAQIRSEFEEQK